MLSTPGSLVEKNDAVDPQGIMQRNIMFRRGLQREVLVQTDICIDSIDPSDVFELPRYRGQSATHKNFGVRLKTSVMHAKPQYACEWKMTVGGVEGIGTSIPGGFHSWVSLSNLLERSDVMPECRCAIEMCSQILKVDELSCSLPGSSSSADSVFARVGGSTDSVSRVGGSADSAYARVGGNTDSVSASPGGVPMSMSAVSATSSVNQHQVA